LIAGRNFGCGSSREHAAWALLDYGFKAIVAASFSDIFTANALKNGLLPVSLAAADHDAVMAALHITKIGNTTPREDPGRPRDPSRPADDSSRIVSIDLASQTVELRTGTGALRFTFPIDPFAKHCLLEGIDQLGFLLAAEREIAAYEQRRSPSVSTAT
jgi:3-isopropylmalate/(R)-2-methylmalate dehydratase small subunit